VLIGASGMLINVIVRRNMSDKYILKEGVPLKMEDLT